MKKIIILALALTMVLALCAGCGGSKQEAQPTAAPTDLPSVTAPPAGAESSGLNSANDDAAPIGQPGQGPDLSSEEAKTAYGLMGQDVTELYNAVGKPGSSEYSASCIAPDAGAEDGLLYYDGFTVSTVRYPDGSEQIVGVY